METPQVFFRLGRGSVHERPVEISWVFLRLGRTQAARSVENLRVFLGFKGVRADRSLTVAAPFIRDTVMASRWGGRSV